MKKLVTHHGKFHADDVFATAWLKTIYGECEVLRIDRKDINKYMNSDEYFVYDIGNGRYDHHSQECKEYRPNGDVYASFGKIVRDTYQQAGLDKTTYLLFDKFIVSPIDVVDNEGPGARISQHSDVVRALNQEDLYGPEQDEAFKRAVEYAEIVLKIMIDKYLKDKELDAKSILLAKENEGKDIVVLDKYHPTNPFKRVGTKFIVYQEFDHWNCNSTDQKNYHVSKKATEELIFRHDSGSFASFKTKNAAIKAAEISLDF